MSKEQDYTPTGLRIEGQYENDRNADNRDLFKAIIREAFDVQDVLVGHHLTYEAQEVRDGFNYTIMEEIPSADTLIFDHDVAQKLWGRDWRNVLVRLALEPCETRDKLLADLYHNRGQAVQRAPACEAGDACHL